MRIALVHDQLTHFGGAERVLEALMEAFPNAPVFTPVYNKRRLGNHIDEERLRMSFLQKIPWAREAHRYIPLGLMPLVVEQFELGDYDVVLSSTHSFSKGIITGPDTMHISYCFTPIRYAWDDSHRYVRDYAPGMFLQSLAPLPLSYIRMWDYCAAQRVDKYVTLSKYVASRIKKYYRREAEVVPPPVNVNMFSVREGAGDYYLLVSRLVPYKRCELAVGACELLGRPLKIVGIGPEEERLKRISGHWTSFLGFVADSDLEILYQGARALIFPQEEDFGITSLEAAASGKPTVAFRAGGAVETVVEGKTGIFFNKQKEADLIKAILDFESRSWDSHLIRRHAEKYNRNVFRHRMQRLVQREWKNFNGDKAV